MCPRVLSPTPTVPIFGDSTSVISKCEHSFDNAAAVIHPDEPPPTMVTVLTFMNNPLNSMCVIYNSDKVLMKKGAFGAFIFGNNY